MVRSPAVAVPSPSVLEDRRHVLVDIDVAVVTPLFGGGATPRAADALLPIRGAAVRGHLRFWWRACHAHLFADAASLFAREAAIWGEAGTAGSSRGPSAIEVEITVTDPGQPEPYLPWYEGEDDRGRKRWKRRSTTYPDYALFPFYGSPRHGFPVEDWDLDDRPATPLVGVKFHLRLIAAETKSTQQVSRDELAQAAERAVSAWLLFGGVGARTRRGCGSLWCESNHERLRPRTLQPKQDDMYRWVRISPGLWLPTLVDPADSVTTLHIPLLQGSRVVAKPSATNAALPAWKAAIELLQQFRQGTNVGRNPRAAEDERRGMSRWPEPYSVRQVWDDLDPGHNQMEHRAVSSYPRADLGLPIGLQQLGPEPFPRLQRADEGASRMASPLILKALPVANSRFVPLALMLNAPHVWEPETSKFKLVRQGQDRYHQPVDKQEPIEPEQLQMPAGALDEDPRGLTTRGGSIRDAFFTWAAHRDGWNAQEVQLP